MQDLLTHFTIGVMFLYPAWQPQGATSWEATPGPFLQLAAVVVGIIALRAFLLLRYLLDNARQSALGEAKRRAVVLIGSLAILLSLAGWEAAARTYQSDEPHYLMVTLSLIKDHDINLANNFANRDYWGFYPFELNSAGGFHTMEGPGGSLYPRHELGLSLALLPGLLFGGKLGVELELALLASGLLVALFSLCRDAGCSVRASLSAWLLIAFTSPFLVFSLQVFPEIIGALLLTVALRSLLVRPKNKWHQLLLGGLALALGPWFHARFWLLLGGVAPFVVRQALTKWKSLLALAVLLLLVVGAFALVGKAVYNVALPNAAVFANSAFTNFFVTPAQMVPRVLGMLFDRTEGLFPTGPIYMLMPAGLLFLFKKNRRLFWPLFFVFVVYFLVNSAKGLWYGGYSPPARYLVCLTPVFFVGVGVAVDSLQGLLARSVVFVLAAASFAISLVLTMAPPLLYYDPVTYGSTLNRLFNEAIHLDPGRIFPNFLAGSINSQAYLLGFGWLIVLLVSSLAVYEWQVRFKRSRPLVE